MLNAAWVGVLCGSGYAVGGCAVGGWVCCGWVCCVGVGVAVRGLGCWN